MKKTLALLTALLLMSLVFSAISEELNYMSIFDSNFDGWYPRSTGGAALDIVEGSIQITGRSQDWNSPGRDFNLVPGQAYEVAVQVYQEEVDSASFLISAAHRKDGRETYSNIVRQEVKKGEWATLTGQFTAGEYDSFVLYVETLGVPTLSFRIRNFSALSKKTAVDMALPRLKDLYADYFDFGNAVMRVEAINTKLMDFYASQFNIMTHGNELKPDNVLDLAASARLAREDQTAVAVKLDAARPLLQYAHQHGIKIHGHVLVWHNQTPDAFFRENYSRTGPYVSRDVMLARLDNYIRLVFEALEAEFPGLVVSFDVVNEAIDDNSGQLRESTWTRIVGQDFVNQAFSFARKHAPRGMALYYNDYSTPYQPKLDGILRLLASLQEEGSIDGHGFQCHYHLHTPSMEQLKTAMDKVIALGLRLRMSEMDILVDAASDENFERQAKRYGEILALFRDYAEHIDAVHTWGVTDNYSWKASQFPLLFDGQGQPKPAFYAVAEPVMK